jgi:hypothetical protein
VVNIGWYNQRRLHRTFKRCTPVEVLSEYSQEAAKGTVASRSNGRREIRGGSKTVTCNLTKLLVIYELNHVKLWRR